MPSGRKLALRRLQRGASSWTSTASCCEVLPEGDAFSAWERGDAGMNVFMLCRLRSGEGVAIRIR